jgi:hypothetical protein
MKKITQFLIIALIALPGFCWAVADPAVTGAAINPSPITAPTGISASFVVANNGTTTSSGAVKITISLSLLTPAADFNVATDITGTAASRFTWVYDPVLNTITGTLNSAWAAATGGTIVVSNLVATGISLPGSESNGINVNVVAPGAVNSSTTNDNTNAYTSSAALPVTLISFEVQKEGQAAQLKWATTEETNSDYFEVQHSVNGKTWNKVGIVKSHGESTVLHRYSFVHATPSSGENLYRLKMVDRDETFAYSGIRQLRLDDLATGVSLYPNPVSDKLYVKDFSKIALLEVIDLTGRSVYKSAVKDASGINVSSLSGGMYIVKITGKDGAQSSQKILINR